MKKLVTLFLVLAASVSVFASIDGFSSKEILQNNNDSPIEYVVMYVNFPTLDCPETIEIIGTFDNWQGTSMKFLGNDWWSIELEATATQSFKFRSAGSWKQELEIYNSVDDVWASIGDNQFTFGQLWSDEEWRDTPCKWIELDFSNPGMYRWTGMCTVSVECDADKGRVTGSGNYLRDTTIVISANANYGYHFVQWNDGITDNPRAIELTQDTTFEALFEINIYTISVTCDNERGSVEGPQGEFECGTELTYTATPKYGYHFSHWSGYGGSNPITVVVTKDSEITAIFEPNKYSIQDASDNGRINGIGFYDYLSEVAITAIPERGFYFVQWADGNADNPRTIELTQDTTMEAIFDYLLTGKCGKDSVLTWTFDISTMALEITGKGALSENYTYGTFIESLTIGNEVTTIGRSAFYGCNNLKNVIIGSSVKVLEETAFSGCSAIETITCYSQRPPTVNNYALYGLDYSTIVYVPADYLNTYIMHDAWGLYDVRPLGAKTTETTDVNVTPSETTAEVAWPSVTGAASYELVIKDKDGNVICTLVFNANGQLTSIAFNAPSRDHAPQQAQASGFSFTVTGLEGGTGYDLTISAKDGNGSTLDSRTISFTTTGEQGIDEVSSSMHNGAQKIVENGQILILRGNRTYTLIGQEVR